MESALWKLSNAHQTRTADPGSDADNSYGSYGLRVVAVREEQFVSAMVSTYRFDPRLAMEAKFAQLYRCLEGARDDAGDWRELVCALRVLANPAKIATKARAMLMSFFDMYQLPEYADAVSRSDLLKLIGFAAEHDDELARTRGALDRHLRDVAPQLGLKPHFAVVQRATFLGVLDMYPALMREFQGQMWMRISETARIGYRHKCEVWTANMFDTWDFRIKGEKAQALLGGNLAAKYWRKWGKFVKQQRKIKGQKRVVAMRKCKTFVQFWAVWAQSSAARDERARIATVMGRRVVLRRFFATRWKRYHFICKHIAWAVRGQSPHMKAAQHGFSLVRHAVSSMQRRTALELWHLEVWFMRNWELAGAKQRELQLRAHYSAWLGHVVRIKTIRRNQADAIAQQAFIADGIAAAQKELERERAEEEARLKAIEDAEWERKAEEKRFKLMWMNQRKAAEKASKDRLINKLQADQRHERVAAEKEELARKFEAFWVDEEQRILDEAAERCEDWLNNVEINKNRFQKEFVRVKREFYEPPTPENVEREAQLKSLASIVLINVEACCFAENVLLERLVQQYDEDSSGYLSHEEFRTMLGSLPLKLSDEDVRNVIKMLDDDGDGHIGMAELEAAVEVMQQTNGVHGSPWKLYVDPAQDVMCYHNIMLGTKIFEHHMTDKILRDVVESNFKAEARHDALEEVRRRKLEHWEEEQMAFSARVLQKLYRHWKAHKELGRLKWKVKNNELKRKNKARALGAARIQATWRSLWERKQLPWRVKLAWERRFDPAERRLYYYNHNAAAAFAAATLEVAQNGGEKGKGSTWRRNGNFGVVPWFDPYQYDPPILPLVRPPPRRKRLAKQNTVGAAAEADRAREKKSFEADLAAQAELAGGGRLVPPPQRWVMCRDSKGKAIYIDWTSVLPYDAAVWRSAVADAGVEARWDVALECKHEKPSGYPRCSNCLQDLARHRIKGDRLRLCHGCFRYAHTPIEFVPSVHAEPLGWGEVAPTMCGVCKQHPAARRCTGRMSALKMEALQIVVYEPPKPTKGGKAAENDLVGAKMCESCIARVKANPGFEAYEWALL